MKDITIVCAGGFGQEVYFLINHLNQRAKERNEEIPYHVLGFISDIPDALEGSGIPEKIIGPIQDWGPIGDEVYAMGISNPRDKERLARTLKSRGCRFESLVEADSFDGTFEMGEGCIVRAYCIGNHVHLGDFVHIMGSMVGGNAVIGDYSTTTGFANLTSARLGKRVFVGSHAVILNKKKIGDDAFICAGSVVVSNVKAGTKVFGVPAKKVDW